MSFSNSKMRIRRTNSVLYRLYVILECVHALKQVCCEMLMRYLLYFYLHYVPLKSTLTCEFDSVFNSIIYKESKEKYFLAITLD